MTAKLRKKSMMLKRKAPPSESGITLFIETTFAIQLAPSRASIIPPEIAVPNTPAKLGPMA
jgi:hypothetical protein